MNPLSLIPLAYRVYAAWALYALCAAAVLGLYAWRVHVERDFGRDEVRAQVLKEAQEEGIAHAKETQRRLDRQQENQLAQTQELEAARAARARADAARDRLSVRIDGLVAAARAAASSPATVGQREAVDPGDPIGVLADVLRRADAAAGVMGQFAWDSRLRGLKCERDYDALTVRP